MTEDKIREALEAGKTIRGGPWFWTKGYMSCANENCCYEDFSSTEETFESISRMVKLDECEILV